MVLLVLPPTVQSINPSACRTKPLAGNNSTSSTAQEKPVNHADFS